MKREVLVPLSNRPTVTASLLLPFEQIVSRITKLAIAVAAIDLAALVIMTVVDVTLRYFFNSPITGSSEITQYMMVGIGFLGLGICALEHQHLKVEIVVEHFSKRTQWVIDIINYIAVIGLAVVLAWRSLAESSIARLLHLTSNITGIPLYPFYWIVTFGFILLALVALMQLVQTIIKGVEE